MRYVNLMGKHKPHLLIKTTNNLGAETVVEYAPSTKFYLLDKRNGKPWITRLPFPVHVVERVETYDHVSRNRFVTRYAYHHGYFDGEEREFRGFGMVEQQDTQEFLNPLRASGRFLSGANVEASSHVPAGSHEARVVRRQEERPRLFFSPLMPCSPFARRAFRRLNDRRRLPLRVAQHAGLRTRVCETSFELGLC